MLTADLVRARRKGDTLTLTKLNSKALEEARGIAESYLTRAEEAAGVHATRAQVMESFGEVPVSSRLQKVAAGLRKLILDRCTFEAEALGGDASPAELRMSLFETAASARREAESQDAFDREGILAAFGATLDPPRAADEVMGALYSDLKAAHRLVSFEALGVDALLDAYRLGQAQAVLLRAESVEVDIFTTAEGADPMAIRHLFSKLKFRGLLHRIERLPAGQGAAPTRDGGAPGEVPADTTDAADANEADDAGASGYRITIDGPFSMFRASTKYGLALALGLPAIRACASWELRAKVYWGKARTPLSFTLSSETDAARAPASPGQRPEVDKVLVKWAKRQTDWRVEVASALLDMPGHGICVPDLTFTHAKTGVVVHLEVLGFWSRDAVWRRVEWAEGALPQLGARILFAVPSRLRVSEEVLDASSSALYVFKGALVPKTLEAHLDALASPAKAP